MNSEVLARRFGLQSEAIEGFATPGTKRDYAPDLALEPVHVEVRLRFDIENESAHGTVTTTVLSNRAGARSLKLDAIGLEDVTIGGAEGRYDGEFVHITWPDAVPPGEQKSFSVSYTVRSPITGLSFQHPDATDPDRPLLVISDNETERARYWMPCVDYPTVRARYDFHLTAPADLTILANGVLESETPHDDGTKTAHWRLDYPCPSYLCCIGIGDLIRVDDGQHGERPIAYFASPRHKASDLANSFAGSARMMAWLEERLGAPFPFSKYYQLVAPGIGGAMENISLTTWDEAFLCEETMQPELGWVTESINLHEMSHSYFGDAIVCRHFEHAWLKESWATYMESVWQADVHGQDRGDYDLHRNARLYFSEAQRYVRPIVTRTYDSSWNMFDLHLYPGGAWRIHMLRHLIGEDEFWAAVRDYVTSYMGKVVETDDFRHKLEEHSGLNLTRFFDEWIHGRGYPRLKAKFTHDAEKNEAKLVIEQTQVDDKRGVGTFTFPLDVRWTDDDGEHTLALNIDGARHSTRFAVTGKPQRIELDPGSKVLFGVEFNPGDDMLRRSLTEAGEIRTRIWAAEELIRTARRANLTAVGEAMANEPFWGVRVAVAQALGKSEQAESAAPLAAMLAAETEPMALRSVAGACGEFRDERFAQALRARLERPAPPIARGELLWTLGDQRHETDEPRLTAALSEPSARDHVARGAARGLGEIGTRSAWDAIEARIDYGRAPNATRVAAVLALGRCGGRLGRLMRDRTCDRLIDATRDRVLRVRIVAASALAALHAEQALPALAALRRNVPQQEMPLIDRLIQRIRKGPAGEEMRKLNKRVEELETRCRKLDERLQDFEPEKS